MSLENPFSAPAPKSVEDGEKKLEKEMENLQLEYVARVWEKKIPPPEHNADKAMSFEEMLKSYGDLNSKIYWAYIDRTGDNTGAREGERDPAQEFAGGVLKEIHAAYDADPATWTSKIDGIIKSSVSKFPESLQKKVPNFVSKTFHAVSSGFNRESRRKSAGLIEYYLEMSRGDDPRTGTKEGEEYMSIHFAELYKQKKGDSAVANIFSSKSLEKLAEDMEKNPNIKSVATMSWLLGSPVGERIGFHSFPIEPEMRGKGFWGQFVNQNGEIDQARAKQFLETGKAPFEMREGYIPREEFLQKYLPKNPVS